jgi:hypothetical protein
MTATLGINNRANESFATTTGLKIKSETTDLIKQTSVLHIREKLYCEDSELNLFSHTVDG